MACTMPVLLTYVTLMVLFSTPLVRGNTGFQDVSEGSDLN